MRESVMKKSLTAILAMSLLFGTAGSFAATEDTEMAVVDAGAYDDKGADQLNPKSSAKLAVDGNDETVWSVFADAVKGYITINLGGYKSINTIRIYDKYGSISEYDYEYSVDGTEWNELAYGSMPEGKIKTDAFSPVQAQYVRLNIYDCIKTEEQGGFSIGEIEIYNDPANKMKASDRNLKKTFKDVMPATSEGRAIELLSALGFVKGDGGGRFRPNDRISRGEFALMITNIFRDELKTGADSPFIDVEGNEDLKQAVSILYSRGIMVGGTDGRFRPDDSITAAEAIKTVVSLLGYDLIAQKNGGYYKGYLAEASELGILKNLSLRHDEAITRGEISLLLVNAFDVNVLGMSSSSGMGMTIEESDNTMLMQYSGIYQDSGIITATQATGLDVANGCAANMVKILSDDMERVYEVGDTDAESYLGYNVKLYYTIDDSDDRVLKCVVEDKTTVLTIPAEDIDSYDGNLKYENGNRLATAKISQTAPVLINGVYCGRLAHALTKNDFDFTSGEVKLINNDSGSEYNVVMISSYINGIVAGVSEASEMILLKAMPKIPFDSENENHKIIKNGQRIKPSDLNVFDVISAMVSEDEQVVTVIVSPYSPVEVTVDRINDESISANGEEYSLCDSVCFNNLLYTKEDFLKILRVGNNVTLYMNIENKVVGVFSEVSDARYGYLIRAHHITDEAEEAFQLKLLTQSGKIERIYCNEKVRLIKDGIEKSVKFPELTAALCDGGITTKGIIRYTVDNDNKVKSVILPNTQKTGEKYETGNDLIPYGTVGEFYNQRFLSNRSKLHATATAKEFIVGSSTVVFKIPDKDNENNEKLYEVTSSNYFGNGSYYDVNALNVSKFGVAEAVLVQVKGSSTTGSAVGEWAKAHCLVLDVAQALNDEDDVAWKITVLNRGKETSFFCDDEMVIWKADVDENGSVSAMKPITDISVLKPGAIIIYDEISPVKAVNMKYPLAMDYKNPDPAWSYSYGWDSETVFGKVMAKDGNQIVLQSTGQYHYSLPEGAAIYKWDAKQQEYSPATTDDILAAENVGEENASWFYYSIHQKMMYIFNY